MKRLSGMMLSEIPFSNMPAILKKCGFDFFIIDYEHGGFDYGYISKILMTAKLCKIEAFVRLADNSRRDIIKFMDMGASGLLLPMTNNADDIQQVTKFAKYAPIGKRGISTMRAHTLYDPPFLLDYMKQANQNTKVFAQIETKQGVDNIMEILQIDGVDGFFLGPNDLSCDLGCLVNNNAQEIIDTIEKTVMTANKLNKLSGIITSNENYINKAKQANMKMFCVGSELSMLKNAGTKTVRLIQE
jgi:2-keto-3-deoxy-L-rhamnonate aldolase RhmA